MHESDKQEVTLESLNETLLKMEHVQMSIFVQLSRIYDVLAVTALGGGPVEVLELLENHEKGVISMPEPSLARFGEAFDKEED